MGLNQPAFNLALVQGVRGGQRIGANPVPVTTSMDLLRQIADHPIDPDYALVAGRSATAGSAQMETGGIKAGGPASPRRKSGLLLTLIAVFAGAMFAVAAAQNTQRAPQSATERTEIISRIQAAEAGQDARRAELATAERELAAIRENAAQGDSAAEAQLVAIADLQPQVGAAAVSGPGIVVTVDDSAEPNSRVRNRVLDLDLQVLVNGLWQAGAEAISVNGHRLSALTAIRGAGSAITVDYRSLTPPYRVEVIGDPRVLPASFAQTSAGAWWNDLARNRGMRFDVSVAEDLTLSADAGLQLRLARSK